jgi:hypothetical protein
VSAGEIRRRFRLVLAAYVILALAATAGVYLNQRQNDTVKKHQAVLAKHQRQLASHQTQITRNQAAIMRQQRQLQRQQHEIAKNTQALIRVVGLGVLNLCLSLNEVRGQQHLATVNCQVEKQRFQKLLRARLH